MAELDNDVTSMNFYDITINPIIENIQSLELCHFVSKVHNFDLTPQNVGW